jgi:O-antigen/teichoic acid export membrane protein
VLLFSHEISMLLETPELEPYLWLLPVGVLLAACASALQFWHARIKAFGSLARTRIGQSCAVVATQIGCGWFNIAPLGLLLGQVLNNGASAVSLGLRLLRTERGLLRAVSWRGMREQFVAYDRFPKYSTAESLTNVASGQLPIVLIAALAVGPEAGFIALALSIIQAPAGLIGGAAAQVYLAHAAEEYRAGRLGAFTVTVIGGLFKAGAGPLLLIGIVAPDAFAIVFGEDWRRAGVLVSWMTPWCVVHLLSYPVSMALPVAGRQRAALVLMIVGLAIRVGFVYAAAVALDGYEAEAYALSGLVFYTIYLALVLRVVAARRADLYAQLKSALPIVVAWCAGAAVVAVLLRAIAPSLR